MPADAPQGAPNEALNGSVPPPQANTRWLWQYLRKRGKPGVLALFSGVIAGITAAASPYLIGTIVDQIRHQVDLQQIANAIVLLIGLTLISIVAFFGQRYFSGAVSYSVNYDIRHDLFDNLLTLDQGFYQRFSTGDLISRMYTDVDMIWRLLLIGFTRGGSALLTIVTAFILLSRINLPLTLVVFIVLGISTSVQMRVGMFLAPIFEQVQAQAGALSALVQDAASGIQTIKTFGRESGVAQQYRAENIEYRRRWLRFERYNEPVGMLPNAISDTTSALVVIIGGILTIQGVLTVGNFVQFLLYLATISVSLLQLGTIYQRFQQTRGAFTRLTPLLQAAAIHDPPQAHPLPAVRGDIRFEHVSVQIEGKWLLRDISLAIPAGKVVAFVGPTGSGKTLLVSLLARVIDPNEGRILLDGHDLRTLQLTDIRHALAYVPQSTFLFSQPLHTNVRMGQTNISDEDLERAIHISRLSNDLAQLPEGLETLVGERGVMLSGGQKQRVAIARAIVRNPSILILDDALSSVDTQTAADILADLRQVLRTRTSLIIAHRIATVKDADQIIVIDHGQIAEQGTHADLLAANGLYAQMVERELHLDDDMDVHGEEQPGDEDEKVLTAGD